VYDKKVAMRDELYIINPPTSSYDNPISLDSLKYMKDKLLGALENPEILDKLGAVALGLYDTAQMLEPMEWVEGEELGDSHPDSDWTDKNIIPLIGCDKFVISGKQMSHMPVQKAKIDEAIAERIRNSESIKMLEEGPSIFTSGINLGKKAYSFDKREYDELQKKIESIRRGTQLTAPNNQDVVDL